MDGETASVPVVGIEVGPVVARAARELPPHAGRAKSVRPPKHGGLEVSVRRSADPF